MKHISANFGAIKDTIYTFSAKEMIAESGKKATILNKFFKLINENPILKVQYLVFKNLENGVCKKEYLAERYINQNLKLIENFKWEEIIKTNKTSKLSLVNDYEVESSSGKEGLYEAIHTLIKSVTKKNFSEIDKAQNAYDFIMEHLMSDRVTKNVPEEMVEESEYPKFLSTKFVTDYAVSEFNSRYAHLNEEEKHLVKILLSTDEVKNNYYNELKLENLESIENILVDNIDDITKAAVNKFKSKILSLNESEIKSVGLDEVIINLADLKSTLSDLAKN